MTTKQQALEAMIAAVTQATAADRALTEAARDYLRAVDQPELVAESVTPDPWGGIDPFAGLPDEYRWAAIQGFGYGWAFTSHPAQRDAGWICATPEESLKIGFFARSNEANWRHSLRERPAKAEAQPAPDPWGGIDPFSGLPDEYRWAAIDADGNAFACLVPIHVTERRPAWDFIHVPKGRGLTLIKGKFDATNWRNSLRERPAKVETAPAPAAPAIDCDSRKYREWVQEQQQNGAVIARHANDSDGWLITPSPSWTWRVYKYHVLIPAEQVQAALDALNAD